jgi:hypothetical protein
MSKKMSYFHSKLGGLKYQINSNNSNPKNQTALNGNYRGLVMKSLWPMKAIRLKAER